MDNLDEFQQLQAPLRRFAAQSHSNHEKLARLKRELAQHEKETTALERTSKPYLIYYARKDCLQLANMMHQKLPAEVRELVYEYLCVEPDRPIPVGPYYHFRPYDKTHRYPPEPFFHGPNSTVTPGRQRTPDLDFYTNHASTYGMPEVDMEESQQGHLSQLLTSSEMQMAPELAQRVSDISRSGYGDNERVADDDTITILPDGRLKETHTHRPPRDMILPSSHVLNPRYVGKDVSREIQKVYYARNTFSICAVENAITQFWLDHSGHHMLSGKHRDVPADLKLEPLFQPVEHVRNLQVRVKCEQFWELRPKHINLYEMYLYERRFLRFTERNIKELHIFSDRQSDLGMNVEFVLSTSLPPFTTVGRDGLEAQCNFVNFLQAIRNTVYRMMYDWGDNLVKVVHYDDGISPFPRDITGLFSLTRGEWAYEKSLYGGVDWTPDFYLATPGLKVDDRMTFGYNSDDVHQMRLERWGMESILDTRSKRPIKEGKFWPKAQCAPMAE